MVNVAIIGFGFMGQKHAGMIKNFDKFNLVGIYDIKKWKCELAREKGIHTFDSYEEMLTNKNVDLVLIALPNHLHKEYAIKAFKKGKNVFCEKPLALNSKEVKVMFKYAKIYKKRLFVHQNRRYDKDFLIIKKLFKDSPNFIREIQSNVIGGRGIPDGWRRYEKFGGGMLYDWGVHLIDQIISIMKDEKIISVYCELFHTQKFEVDDGVRIIFHTSKSRRILINIDTNTFIDIPRWIMLADNASTNIDDWDLKGKTVSRINIDDFNQKEQYVLGNGFSKTMTKLSKFCIKDEALPLVESDEWKFYNNINDCLTKGDKLIVSEQQAKRVLKLIDLCRKSNKKAKIIKCNV